MKSTLKLFVVLCAAMALSNESYGQFAFGVSPGLGLNSAQFGYKIKDRIVPFIGFQYLTTKVAFEESGEIYDSDLNQLVPYSETNEFSGGIYIPNIGVKCFIKQHNKLQAYLSLSVSKPIVSGKMKYDGDEELSYGEDVEYYSLWGGEFGFGIEYFFDENFSLGGEFGLRYLHVNYVQTRERPVYNPINREWEPSEIIYDYRYNLNPTFTKISLNYYF